MEHSRPVGIFIMVFGCGFSYFGEENKIRVLIKGRTFGVIVGVLILCMGGFVMYGVKEEFCIGES